MTSPSLVRSSSSRSLNPSPRQVHTFASSRSVAPSPSPPSPSPPDQSLVASSLTLPSWGSNTESTAETPSLSPITFSDHPSVSDPWSAVNSTPQIEPAYPMQMSPPQRVLLEPRKPYVISFEQPRYTGSLPPPQNSPYPFPTDPAVSNFAPYVTRVPSHNLPQESYPPPHQMMQPPRLTIPHRVFDAQYYTSYNYPFSPVHQPSSPYHQFQQPLSHPPQLIVSQPSPTTPYNYSAPNFFPPSTLYTPQSTYIGPRNVSHSIISPQRATNPPQRSVSSAAGSFRGRSDLSNLTERPSRRVSQPIFEWKGSPSYSGNNTQMNPRTSNPSLYTISTAPEKLETDFNASTPQKSAMLEEFRSNRSRRWTLSELRPYIVEFSKDQVGSRWIQESIESSTAEDRQFIFNGIVPLYTLTLMQDVFGNYVIQKLFEHGDALQRAILIAQMQGSMLDLSLHLYGCRVVQKALDYFSENQQINFVQELSTPPGSLILCVKDANGNHVVQKAVERVTSQHHAFITAFRGSVHDLARHPYGCRVLQRCLEFVTPELSHPLIEEIRSKALDLITDQFGNYVVQYIFENGSAEDCHIIISQMQGQLLRLSKHKFASNVCEKALNSKLRPFLIDELMMSADGVNPIAIMIKDQFANYVLQRAMVLSEGAQREALLARIRAELLAVRRFPHTHTKGIASIERQLEKEMGKGSYHYQ